MMSARSKLEKAISGVVFKERGERSPVVAYVVLAVVVDPESMEFDEPFICVPEGQRDFMTRGMVEECRDALAADVVGSMSYVDWDDGEDA